MLIPQEREEKEEEEERGDKKIEEPRERESQSVR